VPPNPSKLVPRRLKATATRGIQGPRLKALRVGLVRRPSGAGHNRPKKFQAETTGPVSKNTIRPPLFGNQVKILGILLHRARLPPSRLPHIGAPRFPITLKSAPGEAGGLANPPYDPKRKKQRLSAAAILLAEDSVFHFEVLKDILRHRGQASILPISLDQTSMILLEVAPCRDNCASNIPAPSTT
jgi:hypothetical protein